MDASFVMQAKETEVFARLRNIVVTDANSQSLHRKVTFKHLPLDQHPHFLCVCFFTAAAAALVPFWLPPQAVSIVGEEVFSFSLSLFPGATEAERYSDTSRVDGKVTLRMGCIRIVYLHQFLMSLLVGRTYLRAPIHTRHLFCKVLSSCFLSAVCVSLLLSFIMNGSSPVQAGRTLCVCSLWFSGVFGNGSFS